jgi:hypothetical protein
MRKAMTGLGWLLGAFLLIRAIAAPFSIDMSDPVSYLADWGGPSLVGVLAVHMVPGLLAASWMVMMARRRRAPRSSASMIGGDRQS